jgi:hypothetical protein
VVLSNLASKDFAGEVDKASQELGASIKGLGTAAGTDTQKSAAVISTAVDEVARVLTSHLRKDALKQVMQKTQNPLESITGTFVTDQGSIKEFLGSVRTRVLAFSSSTRPKFGTLERYTFDGEIGDLLLEITAIEQALDGISKAVTTIPPAHHDLFLSLDNEKQDLDSLRELISEGQRVRKFYRDLSQK